jgi:NADH:ubiquinone oxidoreductase subunit K
VALEHLIVLSILLLSIGLISLLTRREPLFLIAAIVIIAGSLLLAFTGFSLFWKNSEGVRAIVVVLTLLIIQIVTTLNVFYYNKK